MRKLFNYVSVILCVVLVAAFAVTVKGDNARYVISAKAGGVNIVAGEVIVTRKRDKSQMTLTTKDKLEEGDIVTTGENGRVEITLNPGSYLRLGENSSLELTTTILDDLRLQLFKGSAVIEAAGGEGLAIVLEINTPQTKVFLVKKGIYRLNVTADATEVQVWKGQAEVGDATKLKVKGGNKITIGSTNTGTAKLDKKTQDTLDVWSKERAKFLSKEREQLERKAVAQSMSGFYNGFGKISSGFPFYGAWLFNPFGGCYFFIPFDAWAWSSPYGFNYFDASFGWSFFRLLPFWGSYYCPYRCGSYGYPIINNGTGTATNTGNINPSKVKVDNSQPAFNPSKVIVDDMPTRGPRGFPQTTPSSPPIIVVPSGNSPTKSPSVKDPN
jgi:hypothetical protein